MRADASPGVRQGADDHGVCAAQRIVAKAWQYGMGVVYDGGSSCWAGLNVGRAKSGRCFALARLEATATSQWIVQALDRSRLLRPKRVMAKGCPVEEVLVAQQEPRRLLEARLRSSITMRWRGPPGACPSGRGGGSPGSLASRPGFPRPLGQPVEWRRLLDDRMAWLSMERLDQGIMYDRLQGGKLCTLLEPGVC